MRTKGVLFGSRSVMPTVRVAGISLLVSLVSFGSVSVSWAQSLTWLGTLGGSQSGATGVSADGSVVVGWAAEASNAWKAFRWQNGVMQNLGTLGGLESAANGVSADGNVVVGWSQIFDEYYMIDDRAFRWENGVMQNISPQGYTSAASDASANGSVVVGVVLTVTGQSRAFRWRAGVGMQNLGTLGGSWSNAYDVSADGNVVVG